MLTSVDQTVDRKYHKGISNRCPTHPEKLAQFLLYETLVRAQHAGENIET
jgi:hypothetical protein